MWHVAPSCWKQPFRSSPSSSWSTNSCTPFSFTAAQHNDTAVRDMAPDVSRCPDDVRMSESGKQVSTCFSWSKVSSHSMHVQNLMNSLWDIHIFLGLVPKESHCITTWKKNTSSDYITSKNSVKMIGAQNGLHHSVCTILCILQRICCPSENLIFLPHAVSGLHYSLQEFFSCPQFLLESHIYPLRAPTISSQWEWDLVTSWARSTDQHQYDIRESSVCQRWD